MLTYTNNQFPYTDKSIHQDSTASIFGDISVYGSLRKELAMATLKKRRGNWYARVLWIKSNSERQTEKQIPLRTNSKVTAYERLAEVKKVENDIKAGLEFSLPWLSETTSTKIKRFTLNDAINQWISKRKGKMRNKTIELNELGLGYFADCLGKTCPLKTINSNHIDLFIDYMASKGLGTTTINMHLRTVKAMFRHYLKVDKLDKIPLIEQIKLNKRDPIYITDDEFQSIMELDWMDKFYKQVFLFYRETGMRLREPMMSVLEGPWIDIPNESKGKAGRSIKLDTKLQSIFTELKDWLENGYGSTLKDKGGHFSKMFKKALREIGAKDDKHFHSLRHTYAVRKLIAETSIYELKLLMGHSSVTTTEEYSNMNLKRVAQDFSTLVTSNLNETKFGNMDTDIMDTVKGEMLYIA